MEGAITKTCRVVRGVRTFNNPKTNPATTRRIPAAILSFGVTLPLEESSQGPIKVSHRYHAICGERGMRRCVSPPSRQRVVAE